MNKRTVITIYACFKTFADIAISLFYIFVSKMFTRWDLVKEICRSLRAVAILQMATTIALLFDLVFAVILLIGINKKKDHLLLKFYLYGMLLIPSEVIFLTLIVIWSNIPCVDYVIWRVGTTIGFVLVSLVWVAFDVWIIVTIKKSVNIPEEEYGESSSGGK